jgi:hypothetical protein
LLFSSLSRKPFSNRLSNARTNIRLSGESGFVLLTCQERDTLLKKRSMIVALAWNDWL